VKLGALDLPAFMVDDASPSAQAVHLFVDVQEFLMLKERVAQAGVPADLMGVPEEEVIRTITKAVGTEPSLRDSTDLKASEAWVLVVVAYLDFWMRRAIEAGITEDAARYGIMLGRCIEFWRWRRQGHDRRAAGKMNSEKGLEKARVQRQINQNLDADWHHEACQIALELHKKNRKRSRWNIADELAKEYGKSQRHVSNILKRVLP
jgi:hypothetical protein